MGTVYQAWDNELAVVVALKAIRADALQSESAADLERRFKRELVLARQVTHKNVVRIHDLGEVSGVRYITMPYIEGADLATILRGIGRLPVARALTIARQVVAGLVAAHEADVVHRDLKPANIMVTANDQATILDFGIARSTSPAGDQTMTGRVVGTLEYMAPEQARGETADQRSDVYAVGLILYRSLVGVRSETRDGTAMTDLMQRMQQAPPPMRSIDPSIPQALDEIVNTCLQPDPVARFQSAAALASALARLDDNVGTIEAGAPTSQPASRTVRGVAVGLPFGWRWAVGVLVVAAASGGALWWRERTKPVTLGRPDVKVVAAPAGVVKLIAVLPFSVTNGDQRLSHLVGGLDEALSSRLMQLRAVSAASPASVDAVQRLSDPYQIARELGVLLLVRGSVELSGDRLQLESWIDDVPSQRRLWSQHHAGVREDLVTLQDQMFHGVLTALGVTPESDELARTITHPTENFEAYELYLKGRAAMRQQADPPQLQQAIELFEQALAKDPEFALASARLAGASFSLYRSTRNAAWSARAVSAAQRAAQSSEQSAQVHMIVGDVYRRTGRTAESLAELRKAVQLAPTSIDAHRQLGDTLKAAGRSSEAIQSYRQAISINPYNWTTHNALGAAYLETGDYARSIEVNQKVIELSHDNVNGHNDLGAAYLMSGRFDEASVSFEKALQSQKTSETYTNLGIAYYYGAKFKESVPMFEKAAELTPGAHQWVGNLADGYRWAGLAEKARVTYDRAIALGLNDLRTNPRNAAARGAVGLYYAKNGDVVRGLKFIRDARAINGSLVELMYNEALALALGNRTDEALAALKAAFDAGHPVWMAASDPDLRGLQRDARFDGMVRQYSKSSSAVTLAR